MTQTALTRPGDQQSDDHSRDDAPARGICNAVVIAGVFWAVVWWLW